MNLPPNRAAWPPKWREAFEERAGIIEHDARLPRAPAEYYAEQDVRKQAAGGYTYPMKALSLWQPWASLIYDERKSVETRSWEMLHRGPLAIHAAMKVDKEACEDFGYGPDAIPRGAVLCVVNVLNCVRFPHDLAPPDEYGDFEPGRFGFLLKVLQKFDPPILAKGHQGIWYWEGLAEREKVSA